MNPKNTLLNNIGLKFLSLCLAVLSWFYIVGEIKKEVIYQQASGKEAVGDTNISQQEPRIISRVVPVYPKIKGKPQDGYKVLEEQVCVKPATVTIRGNVELVNKISFVSTETIDVRGQNKALVRKASLEALPKDVEPSQQKDFDVIIPIEKAK